MYKLLNYAGADGKVRPAVVVGDSAVDLPRALASVNAPVSISTTLDVCEHWDETAPVIDRLAEKIASGALGDESLGSLSALTLRAPLLYPGALLCAGANYRKHAFEMTGKEFDKTGKRPYFFSKLPRQCVIGPNDPIPLLKISRQVDWEVELAAVIGRPALNVDAKDALDYVAGYTIMNDVSARDLGKRDDWPRWGMDWLGHKSFNGAAPMGPWIVPARAIADPHDLDLKLWVNDELQQDSNTDDMIFNINEQIEYLSSHFTLWPGDVISTGTPSGVGRPRGLFLKPGDRVRMEIEGIGSMENPVVQG